MYTECPSCHTFFKVTSAQLKLAEGKVRCGNCSEVFNAVSSLMDEVPPSALNRNESIPADPDTVFSGDSDIEMLENDEQAFLDIEVPGEAIPDAVEDESSLEGLADSEVISVAVENASLSELSELSDLTDLSDVSELEPDTKPAAPTQPENIMQSEIAELDDIGLSDIEINDDDLIDNSEGSVEVEGAQSRSNLSDINRDIDDALDGLFDDELLSAPATEASSIGSLEGAEASLNSVDPLTDVDDILKDDVLPDLPDLEGDEGLPNLDLEKSSSESVDLDDMALDLSDEPDSFLSKSDERRKEKNDTSLDDFELGDSLLNSESLDIEDSDWSPGDRTENESEMYSGDSFILEELDDDVKSGDSNGLSKVLWVSLIFLLVIVLTGQFVYLKREALVKYPQMLPILEFECSLIRLVMPCEVPERRAPEMVELVDRNIITHPKVDNALLITTTIKNNADFVQPYPKMVLTFSDINQKVVAKRMFTPEEYLAKDVDISKGMEIGVPIKVILEIVDPGEDAVNFEFDFN